MARKLPRLDQVLRGRDLFSVAYGEVASSIYFALGIVAFHALGLTPAVLALVGIVFFLVALSYAEAIASAPETGGAATFVRRAFNDVAGFAVGWVLFLDYLIVIALTTLFVPHYFAGAIQMEGIRRPPWDTLIALALIALLAVMRLGFRPSLYRFGIVLAVLDLATQLLLILLGFALVFSPHAISSGFDLGVSPSWSELAFALPLATLAFTGLETVANLSEETRRPTELPGNLFRAIGAVIVVYVLIAIVGLSAFPVENGSTALGLEWRKAPLLGIVVGLQAHLPGSIGDVLRVFVGLTGTLILLLAATTAISGLARLSYSLGEHGMLPAAFGRLSRRTLVSPQSLLAVVVIGGGLLIGTEPLHNHGLQGQATFLASLFSFGVLIGFSAAQLAVIRLRYSDPERDRPFRIPLSVPFRGGSLPLPAVAGVIATASVFVLAMVTHPAARYGGPIWLALGLVVYALVRRQRGAGLLEQVPASNEQELPEARFATILVPMKLGDIGEEMMATAVRVAQDRNAAVIALNVINVPLDRPLDEPPDESEKEAAEALEEARALGAEHGVPVRIMTVHARSVGAAIVEEAVRLQADLIVLGSAPRWRRQSRFFSPAVEYVLRKAPCEVMIVTFPEGVLESELQSEEEATGSDGTGAGAGSPGPR
jgi:APA family basic amino acid/polyamine antiporter